MGDLKFGSSLGHQQLPNLANRRPKFALGRFSCGASGYVTSWATLKGLEQTFWGRLDHFSGRQVTFVGESTRSEAATAFMLKPTGKEPEGLPTIGEAGIAG